MLAVFITLEANVGQIRTEQDLGHPNEPQILGATQARTSVLTL